MEALRTELYEAIQNGAILTDPEIVRKSQELDQLIVQAMRGGE